MKVNSLLIVFFFSCFSFIQGGCQRKDKDVGREIPLLVFTDFGRDVDDAEAFTYLAMNPDLKVVGVVCNSYIPQVRAETLSLFLNLMDYEVPVATGSTFPMDIEDETLIDQYFSEHSINGIPYEISLKDSLLQWVDKPYSFDFDIPENLINILLEQYSKELRVVILSQPTDFAEYFSLYPEKLTAIHSIYIQGQARIDSLNRLRPDSAAYNLREDMKAAEFLFSLQDSIPFTVLGKYAAYPMAYTREEFSSIADNDDKIGNYLYHAANMGLECFLQRDSVTFYRVFEINDSIKTDKALQYTDKISNPYDLLTVIAIDRPELFNIDTIGKHSLIGMSSYPSAFKDSLAIKNLLLALTAK